MRVTGIVRKIDELGRIVIPKELRRAVDALREETAMEFFLEDGKIIMRPYYPYNDCIAAGEEFLELLNQIPDSADEEEKKTIRAIIDRMDKDA